MKRGGKYFFSPRERERERRGGGLSFLHITE